MYNMDSKTNLSIGKGHIISAVTEQNVCHQVTNFFRMVKLDFWKAKMNNVHAKL